MRRIFVEVWPRWSAARSGGRFATVATPWGPSDSLRGRRLRPGPGASSEEVEKNQRERLYGGTIAAVHSLGYEASLTLLQRAFAGLRYVIGEGRR